MDEPDTHSYLLKAVNAAIHLQALVLKQHKQPRQEVQKLRKYKDILDATSPAGDLSLTNELKRKRGWSIDAELCSFMTEDFYKILQDNALVPDRHTYEVYMDHIYSRKFCRI